MQRSLTFLLCLIDLKAEQQERDERVVMHASRPMGARHRTPRTRRGFEGRHDYAAIGTVSNVASRLCDEAKPGQILISPRVLMAVKDAVTVEAVGEFELKGIRRPTAAYNVLADSSQRP